MKVVECPSCHLEFDRKSKECPYCGYSHKKLFAEEKKGGTELLKFIIDCIFDGFLSLIGDILDNII